MRLTGILTALAVLLLGAAESPASAQPAYPTKPIRFIVPWPPGGGTDAVARLVAQRVAEDLGQQVIVENRGGAGTVLGIDATAKAEPDGYTFGVATQSFAVNATLQPKLPYDTLRDLEPVVLIGTGVYVLVVHPTVQAKTPPELIAWMKGKPGDVAAGFTGHGSPGHLGLVEFVRRTGVQPIEVNYRGTGPGVVALLGGETQVMFATLSGVLPHIQSGKVKALAVTSPARSALLPELPTAGETGLPDFSVFEWYGLVAPRGTARDRIERMNASVRKALATPDLQARIKAIGAEPAETVGTPEAFGVFLRAEVDKWGRLVREAALKPE